MKLEITAPRESEAEVEINSKAGVLTISPHFLAPTGVKEVCAITVRGDKGRVRRYLLQVYGQNGRLTAREARCVSTGFDNSGPDDKLPEDSDAKEEADA